MSCGATATSRAGRTSGRRRRPSTPWDCGSSVARMDAGTCQSCGTENPASARFCMSCGAQLERRCSACRAVAPPQARFCMECGTPLGEVPAAPAAPPEERRQVTVLFADLSGYTAATERMDPERVKALVDSALRRLAQEVERFGGTVDKYIGDNV